MHGNNGMGMGWMNLWWIFAVVIGVLWLVFKRLGPTKATGRLPLRGIPKRRLARGGIGHEGRTDDIAGRGHESDGPDNGSGIQVHEGSPFKLLDLAKEPVGAPA